MVILIGFVVNARMCSTSRTCTGVVRRISPIDAGTIWPRIIASLDFGGIVDIDAAERIGEAVEIAFAADFTVAEDIEAGGLLLAQRLVGGVILRFLEELVFDAPDGLRRTRGG